MVDLRVHYSFKNRSICNMFDLGDCILHGRIKDSKGDGSRFL